MGYDGNRGRSGPEHDRGYARSERDRYNAPSARDYREYGRDRSQGGYGRDDRGGRDYRQDYGRTPQGYDYQDRGFFDRAGDEVRSWFGDEEAERRRRMDDRYAERDERSYGGRDRDRGYDQGYGVPGFTGDYGAGDYGARAPWEGGERDRQRGQHDAGYRSWRDRQISDFDRDYDEYRREHQSRFDSEFRTWRESRQTQRSSLDRVAEHQEIVGSDGQHVGTVDKVRGDRIILTKTDKDAGGHHHSIPSSWIKEVTDKVTISKTADQAKQHWRDEERNSGSDWNQGERALGRSFSGTY